jgi:ribosomal protein L7/L12
LIEAFKTKFNVSILAAAGPAAAGGVAAAAPAAEEQTGCGHPQGGGLKKIQVIKWCASSPGLSGKPGPSMALRDAEGVSKAEAEEIKRSSKSRARPSAEVALRVEPAWTAVGTQGREDLYFGEATRACDASS